jgi:hypothetical protein
MTPISPPQGGFLTRFSLEGAQKSFQISGNLYKMIRALHRWERRVTRGRSRARRPTQRLRTWDPFASDEIGLAVLLSQSEIRILMSSDATSVHTRRPLTWVVDHGYEVLFRGAVDPCPPASRYSFQANSTEPDPRNRRRRRFKFDASRRLAGRGNAKPPYPSVGLKPPVVNG